MSKTPQDHQYQGTLPPGWTAVWDNNEGDYYFWNKETNETTWDNPSAVEKDTESSKINHHEPSESLQNAEVHDGRVLFIDASGKNNGLCDLAILQKAVQSGQYGPAASLIKVSDNHNMDGKIVSVYRVQTKDQEFADVSPRSVSATITVANKVRKWKEVKISKSIGANDLNVKIKQIKLSLQSDHPVKVVLNADKKRKSQFSLSKPNFGPDILKQIKQTLSSDGSLKGTKFTEPSRVNDFQWLAQIQPSVKKQN
ncbi:hypothetical protein MIR68_012501 [Amoeboaphelidium protococcarum]|nr:hypothetical protein MIR68_012501 [Amoeboaphelidium protococcarum]